MIKHALKFVRPRILFTCYLIVLLGSLSVGLITAKSFLAILVLFAWYVHAATSNDYADRKIDAVNLKGDNNRPLVTKTLALNQLWVIHFSAGALALILSVFYGLQAVLLTLIILAFSYAYSFKPLLIKNRGALSQLILPIAYVCYPFSLGYWSTDTSEQYSWVLLAGLYTGFIARLFLKDFRDVKGDAKFGKRTFLIRHGRKMTCIASAVFGSISLVLLSFAISFAVIPLAVLLLGHILALGLLKKLANTKEIRAQVKTVGEIANIANISVITVLVYYFSKQYL